VPFDVHVNFGYSTVATAPSPASTGTSLTLAAGGGALMPTPPFNATIWPTGQLSLKSNAEIVRVTAISVDTLTITRAQEGSTARAITASDQVAASITAKTFQDVELLAKGGDVVGPASAVDNSVALYSGTTGKLLKDASQVTVDPATGNIVTPGVLVFTETSIDRTFNGGLRITAPAPVNNYTSLWISYTGGQRLVLQTDVNWGYVYSASTTYGLFINAQGGSVGIAFKATTPGNPDWLIDTYGHFRPYSLDNAQDIGAANNQRLRDIYVGTSVQIGTNPATVGAIRLANNTGIYWRNAANTADITALRLDGNNDLFVGTGASYAYFGSHLTPTPSATYGLGNPNSKWTELYLSVCVSIGTNPASAGAIRLANAQAIVWRNAANTADILAMQVGSNGLLDINPSGTGTQIGNSLTMYGGSQYFAIGNNPAQSGAIRLANNTTITARNAANTADINLLQFFTDNFLYVGTNSSGLTLRSASPINCENKLYPIADNTYDIGAASFRWKDGYFSGSLTAGGLGSTPLNATNLTSGTVADARLSVNVLKYTGGYPGGTTNFLRADGTFAAPAGGGTGNVTGPATAVLDNLATYADATGKVIKDSGVLVTNLARRDTSNTYTAAAILSYANPSFLLNDTSQVANSRVFVLDNVGTNFEVVSTSDDYSTRVVGLKVSRVGDVTVLGNLSQGGRFHELIGNMPFVALKDMSQAADARAFIIQSVNQQLVFKPYNDAYTTSSGTPLALTRANATPAQTTNRVLIEGNVQLSTGAGSPDPAARLKFYDAAQAVDGRRWEITAYQTKLYIQPLNDAETAVQTGSITLERGAVTLSGKVKVGAGAVPYSDGDLGVARTSAPTTGVIYFGNNGGVYIWYDGSNWTFAGGNITGNFRLGRTALSGGTLGISGGTITIDLNGGMAWGVILNQNVTNLIFMNTPAGSCTVTLLLRQDGTGGRTVSFPGVYVQGGWTMPTAANAWAILVLYYDAAVIGTWCCAPFYTQ
jgi:hypothetical protein